MIIFLNGASSSGKTTIATALQELCHKPLLVFGIDKFFAMMPKKYISKGEKAKDGFQYKIIQEGVEPIAKVISGKYGTKVANTAPYVIEALASCDHDVIVDEVILSEDNLKQYVKILYGQKVYFVGVSCSVKELNRREISRGNRVFGLGRGQIDQVHKYTKQYKLGTITGCYEDEAQYFNSTEEVIKNLKVTDDVKWMLTKYQKNIYH